MNDNTSSHHTHTSPPEKPATTAQQPKPTDNSPAPYITQHRASRIEQGWRIIAHDPATQDTFDWLWNQPSCRCGTLLTPSEASGAGGYVNGYVIWSASRRDASLLFTSPAAQTIEHIDEEAVIVYERQPQHDVVERQWYPTEHPQPNEQYERRHAGTCGVPVATGVQAFHLNKLTTGAYIDANRILRAANGKRIDTVHGLVMRSMQDKGFIAQEANYDDGRWTITPIGSRALRIHDAAHPPKHSSRNKQP